MVYIAEAGYHGLHSEFEFQATQGHTVSSYYQKSKQRHSKLWEEMEK